MPFDKVKFLNKVAQEWVKKPQRNEATLLAAAAEVAEQYILPLEEELKENEGEEWPKIDATLRPATHPTPQAGDFEIRNVLEQAYEGIDPDVDARHDNALDALLAQFVITRRS